MSLLLFRLGANAGFTTVAVGNVGNQSATLQLAADSAAKPATNTWTISSDERIKEDISPADLDRCVSIVRSLPLKNYKWRDDVYSTEQVPDRHKLGWIAQDVEPLIPKAVTVHDMHGIPDCRSLNADQIYAVMYGALQKALQQIEELQASNADLQQRIAAIESAR